MLLRRGQFSTPKLRMSSRGVSRSYKLPSHFLEVSEREDTNASFPKVAASLIGVLRIQHGNIAIYQQRLMETEGPRAISHNPDTSV